MYHIKQKYSHTKLNLHLANVACYAITVYVDKEWAKIHKTLLNP